MSIYPLLKNVICPDQYNGLENHFGFSLSKFDTVTALTALVQDVVQSNKEMLLVWIDLLLKHQVPIIFRSIESPLVQAICLKKLDIAKFLLKGVQTLDLSKEKDIIGMLLVNNNISPQSIDLLDDLLEKKAPISYNLITQSAMEEWDWFDVLFKKSGFSESEVIDRNGNNLLIAFFNSFREVEGMDKKREMPLDEIKNRVEYYLRSGLDINACNNYGQNCFFHAAFGCEEVVPYLIEKGADPLAINATGSTVLYNLVNSMHPIKLEQDYGMINVIDDQKRNVLHLWGQDLVESGFYWLNEEMMFNLDWLLKNKLEINALDSEGYASWHLFFKMLPTTLSALLKYGADLNLKPGKYVSLFQCVASNPNADQAMDFLMGLGLRPESEDKEMIVSHETAEQLSPKARAWYEHYYLSQSTKALAPPSSDSVARRI